MTTSTLKPRPASHHPAPTGRPSLARQLHDALNAGDVDSARLLLALGAPMAGDPQRQIPAALVTAVRAQRLERDFVRELIHSEADVHEPVEDPDGNTLLHLAVMHRPEVVPILLEKGANPNKTNKRGETPLLLAVREGDLKTMHSLLSWGADPHRKAAGAPSAFDFARKQALTHPRGGAILDYLEQSLERRRRALPPTNPIPSAVEGLVNQLPSMSLAERLERRRAAALAPMKQSAHEPGPRDANRRSAA